MFFVLSKLLDVLLSPLTWAIALVLAALPFRMSRPKKPQRQRVLLAAAALVLALFSWAPVSNGLVAILEASAHDTTRAEETYDAIVLLGGTIDDAAGSTGDLARDTEYNEHVERLLVTFDWLRTGRAKFAILSGGPVGNGGAVEAERLRDQLVSWGIEPDRLIVEGRSMNTRENAVFTAPIVKDRGFTSLVLVTSAFHMKRAQGCFRAAGIDAHVQPLVDAATLPVDYGTSKWSTALWSLPRSQHLDASTRAIRELFGRLVYAVSGYTK